MCTTTAAECEMTSEDQDRARSHWNDVYGSKSPADVSWFQSKPSRSLELIRNTGIEKSSPIIDVGGGASTLVDHLLDDGHTNITVLDLSANALAHARARLGDRSIGVNWVAADVTTWSPTTAFDLWHDRAVLHFLRDSKDQAAYGDALRASLAAGGWAVIAGFAPGGPLKCSGLDIVQHDADSLQKILGDTFHLEDVRDETHSTPWASTQAFRYHLYRRA